MELLTDHIRIKASRLYFEFTESASIIPCVPQSSQGQSEPGTQFQWLFLQRGSCLVPVIAQGKAPCGRTEKSLEFLLPRAANARSSLCPGIIHLLSRKSLAWSCPGRRPHFITSLASGYSPGAGQRCQSTVRNQISKWDCSQGISSCWLTAKLFVNFVRKHALRGFLFQVGSCKKSAELESNFSRNNWAWILLCA